MKPSMNLDILDSGIAVISIDLPHSKVNTLGQQSMTELSDLVGKIAGNPQVKGLVIASGKADGFIAGADVQEISAIQAGGASKAYEASSLGKEIFARIEELPFPTVAAINGICLGGGTELSLACKYRVASSKAKIGLPEIKLGFVPGWGGCVRLPRLVGLATAMDLILTGRTVSARSAWKAGLVSEVVDDDDPLPRALEIARGAEPKKAAADPKNMLMRLALETNPLGRNLVRSMTYKGMMAQTKGKYPAAKEAIDLVIAGATKPRQQAFEMESQTFGRLAATPVSKNLVGIFFAQTASKKLPATLDEKDKLATIGVLGAGVMGAGIAQAAAKAGYAVVVKDVKQEFVDKGKQSIQKLFDSLVKKGKMKQDEVDKTMSAMVFTTSYDALADCDLVIEAVIEDLPAKRSVLKELEAVNKKNFVFGSNTSSLSVSAIGEQARDPSSVVGIHFFNPVHKMPLVEIVRAAKSSERALAMAMQFAMKLDKTTVITADSPGFVVNRILAPYLREAAVLLEEGAPAETIDKAVKSFGMPMGPLALLDEVGLDIAGKVAHVMYEALGERLRPPPLMQKIEGLKLLGKKGGKGIYLYDEKGKPAGMNPDVSALISAPSVYRHKEEIQDRLVLLMANEAVRILEEKIVDDPSQLDLALIFGTGFPPFAGGILRYIDSQGPALIVQKLEMLAAVQGERYVPCKLLKEKARHKQPFYARQSLSNAIA